MWHAERRGRMGNSSASYMEIPVSNLGPETYNYDKEFRVFLSHLKQIPASFLRLDYDRFLPDSSQFITL
jgi:hypothetical protein